MGSGKSWIYLPELPSGLQGPVTVVVEAHLNYWGEGPLQLVEIPTAGHGPGYCRVIPSLTPDDPDNKPFVDVLPHNPAGTIEFRWVTAPRLTLELAGGIRIEQPLEQRPGYQQVEFSVKGETLGATQVLYLQANFAFRPSDMGYPDSRLLSCRINRVILQKDAL